MDMLVRKGALKPQPKHTGIETTTKTAILSKGLADPESVFPSLILLFDLIGI
jgi:hypothetical protein